MSEKSGCSDARHHSRTIKETQIEKIYPRTKKSVTIIKEQSHFLVRNKSKILTK